MSPSFNKRNPCAHHQKTDRMAGNTETRSPSPIDIAGALLKTMRPHQWVKNLFVFAPLIFARRFVHQATGTIDWLAIGQTTLVFGMFCLTSGAVYLLNDIVDRDKDRLHPTKRLRPIPSGRLSVPTATIVSVSSAIVALTVGLLWEPLLAGVLTAYLTLNVAYSFILKHIVFADVISIATGFLLRILGGAIAITVPVTVWLYACTFLLASFLGLGKRKHEILLSHKSAHAQRRVLRSYRLHWVNRAMVVLGIATAVCYTAYTVSEHAIHQFGSRAMVFTVPFIVVGLFRFVGLLNRSQVADSPTDAMLKDRWFLTNLAAWVVVVLWIVYRA